MDDGQMRPGLQILLVEDDEDDYVLVRNWLAEIPGGRFQLHWAPSFDRGLEQVCHGRFDVYLLDYRLGERTGLELLKEVMGRDCRTPVIFLTGQGNYDIDMEAMRAGATDYLVKGQMSADLLDRAIRYAIERRRIEEDLRQARDELEERVRERTIELSAANAALRNEIVVRRRAEEAISRAKKEWERTFDSVSDLIAVVDGDGLIGRMNQAMADHLGLAPQTAVGIPCRHLFPDQEIHPGFCLCPENGEHSFELHDPRTGRDFILKISPLKDASGEVTGAVHVARDITERKRAEEELKASLNEKLILLREIHHRVKNNLQIIASLINLQSVHGAGRPAEELFREATHRIHSMALIHETLYQSENLARINLEAYVSRLISHLFQSYGASGIETQIDIRDVYLDIGRAVPCCLLLNELVSNSLKHAFPNGRHGKITINGRAMEDRVIIEVRDNGIGIRGWEEKERGSTLGLKLVRMLIKQLGGTVTYIGNGGCAFRLEF